MAPCWGPVWQGGHEAVGLQPLGCGGSCWGSEPFGGCGELLPYPSSHPSQVPCPSLPSLSLPEHHCLAWPCPSLPVQVPHLPVPCPSWACPPLPYMSWPRHPCPAWLFPAHPSPACPCHARAGCGPGRGCHITVHAGNLDLPPCALAASPPAPLLRGRSPAPRCCRLQPPPCCQGLIAVLSRSVLSCPGRPCPPALSQHS